jgi:acetate kinase
VNPRGQIRASVLVINGGSSSVKFAVHAADAAPEVVLSGTLDLIDRRGAALTWRVSDTTPDGDHQVMLNGGQLPDLLAQWLEARPEFGGIQAVGHRIVHGMTRVAPERITADTIEGLKLGISFAPDHLPRQIAFIETFQLRHPDLVQVACFDTAFHADMPRVATLLPIPRRYQVGGIRRYGFHGLSYAYLLERFS